MGKIRLLQGYWIPTENEWYKAAYYDPNLNGGTGGYWNYATQSNTNPTPVTANSIGDGSAGGVGNFANYNWTADWNLEDGNVTTVGSNGGPSAYGTYDQSGNVFEWTSTIASNEILGPGAPPAQLVPVSRGGSCKTNILFNTLSKTWRSTGLTAEESNSTTGFRIATLINPLNLSNFVTITNPNNVADNTTYGSVDYQYQIGKYEITNDDYLEFLNSIGNTDTYNVYDIRMKENIIGGIIRSGELNNYTYSVKPNMGNKPVNYISWFSCARYCNWLTNGKPTGNQDASTTESGIYPLYGSTSGIITKNQFKINKINESFRIRS